MNTFLPQLVNTIPLIAYVFAGVYLLVIIILAAAVFQDAQLRTLTNKGTFLVGPVMWALIILITGGFSGALAYWLIHYSALRYIPKDRSDHGSGPISGG